MSNAVLLEVPKCLHAQDWVAFESVLRNLWKLEKLPISTLTDGLYSFLQMLDGPFTAEQLLDEIDRVTASIRVAIQNQRAAQSKL